MADTVRYLLEEMVPELEALEARGYFSRAEIRAIVQRRQDFEYALKRMAAVKEDYLRYVAYERQLDELREARRSSRGISGKRGLAEWCITRRIHFIYERATRKFRGDLGLWSRWLRFCASSRSGRRMSRVLAKALQLHSGCAALWAYAAAWELEHNLNAGAARALMQRGLRMCPHAPALWHEYFRMELVYALRLRERRRVLGIDAGDDAAAAAEDAAASGDDGGGDGTGGEEGDEGGGGGDESAAAVAAVLNGAVAGVVFRSAIAAVPASVPFRARFLKLLRPLHFPGRAALEDAVYDSVAADFGGSPEAWDLRARRQALALAPGAPPAARRAAAAAALAVYQEGLRCAPSPQLTAALLRFLQQQLRELDEEGGGGGGGGGEAAGEAAGHAQQQQRRQRAAEAAELARWLVQWSRRVYEEAGAAGLLTEELRLQGIAFFLHQGEVEAAAAAARAAVAALPHSAPLWQQLIAIQAVLAADQLAGDGGQQAQQARQGAGSSDDDDDDEAAAAQAAAALPGTAATATRHSSAPAQRRLEEVVLHALWAVPAADAAPLWLTAVGVLCGGGCSLQALSQQMVQAALRQPKGPVEGGLGVAAAALLTALARAGGIEAARSLYRALLPLPPPGGDFFRCLLQLEMQEEAAAAAAAAATAGSQPTSGGSTAGPGAPLPLPASRLRDLFEAATGAYGSEDVQLWLLYCEWQASRGATGDVAGVCWRARKALRQPEAFETAYLVRFKLHPTLKAA